MEYDYLLGASSAAIKGRARQILKGNWKPAAIFMFIYLCIDELVPGVIDYVTGPAYVYDFSSQLSQVQLEAMSRAGQSATQEVYAGSPLYAVLISGALALGLCISMLLFVRKGEIRYSNIFEGFTYFVKALCTLLLIAVKVLLWSFLFVLPAIPAAFNYSQAFYILADDPSKGPLQCIHESTAMMKGNKMNLFILQISFIGWAILLAIADSIFADLVSYMIPGLASNTVLLVVLTAVELIPAAFLNAYLITSRTVFYQILHGEYSNEPSLQVPTD
ncbi:MAG: DUF975 family protein [Clostridia bacterium]|nr:DUF975 family protein [Clostridia bacterium]